MSGKRVTQPSVVQEFRQKAANLQAMAAAATEKGPFVKRNLERLAARFRTIAAQLAAELRAPDRTRVRRPGAPALYEGLYQELNSFGTPTGRTVRAPQGLQLPAAPHGFTWRLADRDAAGRSASGAAEQTQHPAGQGQYRATCRREARGGSTVLIRPGPSSSPSRPPGDGADGLPGVGPFVFGVYQHWKRPR